MSSRKILITGIFLRVSTLGRACLTKGQVSMDFHTEGNSFPPDQKKVVLRNPLCEISPMRQKFLKEGIFGKIFERVFMRIFCIFDKHCLFSIF
jgi:hypothetical protein